MYDETYTQEHQTKTRWGQWRGFNRSPHRFKQRRLYLTVRQCNKTVIRHRHAIQHEKQWRSSRFISIHEREKGVDFIRCPNKSKSAANRSLITCTNSSRSKTEQSKLVRPDMVISRRHKRLGNKFKQLASRSICKVAGAFSKGNKKETPSSSIKRKALRKDEIKSGLEKTQLFVHRTHRPCFISVLRTKDMLCLSVQRIYASYFLSFSCPYIGHHLDIPLYICELEND